MQKVIRDGKVAVLYSPGYGAGWSTWSVPVEGIFHPELVEAVERNATADLIEGIARRLFGDGYYGGASQLKIEWIDEGTLFNIVECNGFESIEYAENQQWIIA